MLHLTIVFFEWQYIYRNRICHYSGKVAIESFAKYIQQTTYIASTSEEKIRLVKR